jgi:epoxyqueuosine reductase QueG
MVEKGLAKAIKEHAADIIARSSFNELMPEAIPAVDGPLVGFADGHDSIFDRFKVVVRPEHRSPVDAWLETFPGERPPAELSVIAFVLPFSEEVRASNRSQEKEPSIEWVKGKAYCEIMLKEVGAGLVSFLKEKGYRAIIPARSPAFGMGQDAQGGPASNWSERHQCYAAGLGTFGLSKGLITEKGIAMRCGSIVADVALPPASRPDSHTAYCLFLEAGECGECIQRCPAGAITPDGKDNQVCRAYLSETLGPLIPRLMSKEELERTKADKASSLSACGLCNTNVPCEAGIPA